MLAITQRKKGTLESLLDSHKDDVFIKTILFNVLEIKLTEGYKFF